MKGSDFLAMRSSEVLKDASMIISEEHDMYFYV